MTDSEADKLARKATHNNGSDTVALGKDLGKGNYDSYYNFAKQTKSTYFKFKDNKWNNLVNKYEYEQMVNKVNMTFINQQYSYEKSFITNQNIMSNGIRQYYGGAFDKEIEKLFNLMR